MLIPAMQVSEKKLGIFLSVFGMNFRLLEEYMLGKNNFSRFMGEKLD